jgi:hypothetical protein
MMAAIIPASKSQFINAAICLHGCWPNVSKVAETWGFPEYHHHSVSLPPHCQQIVAMMSSKNKIAILIEC